MFRAKDVRRVVERLGIEVASSSGNELSARCPYHEDRDPSWSVAYRGPRAGQQHCFSCQAGGDLVDLVMHVKGFMTASTAIEWLTRHDADASPGDLRAPQAVLVLGATERRAFRMPAGVVRGEPLGDWPGPPREYALARGLTAGQVERWGIGYAAEGRLAGRIVVPVDDAGGRLVGYMARSYAGQAKPYLYPRGEEGPDLSVLFGESRWPVARAIEDRPLASGRVVVTEGALKSLAVERAVTEPSPFRLHGVAHAALGGSNVSLECVAKLSRFDTVVLMTDADEAGDRAAGVLGAALRRHVPRLARVRLDRDPDEMGLLDLARACHQAMTAPC